MDELEGVIEKPACGSGKEDPNKMSELGYYMAYALTSRSICYAEKQRVGAGGGGCTEGTCPQLVFQNSKYALLANKKCPFDKKCLLDILSFC